MAKKCQNPVVQQYVAGLQKSLDMTAKAFGISENLLEEVRNALLSGVPMYQILNIKESVIQARYALAYQLYTSGQLKKAESLFRWLCSYSNIDVANWMGLGACRQAQENYEGAMEAYQMAALYGALEDPAPFFYCGICLLKLQRKDDAKVAMQTVLTLGDTSRSEHKVIMDKATEMLSSLEKGA